MSSHLRLLVTKRSGSKPDRKPMPDLGIRRADFPMNNDLVQAVHVQLHRTLDRISAFESFALMLALDIDDRRWRRRCVVAGLEWIKRELVPADVNTCCTLIEQMLARAQMKNMVGAQRMERKLRELERMLGDPKDVGYKFRHLVTNDGRRKFLYAIALAFLTAST